jgi:hypothetical protein
MTCHPKDNPPGDSCKADGDCIISMYESLVTSVDDCFCPMCDFWAMSESEHTKRKTAWIDLCSAWSDNKPCPMPKCKDPGEAICEEGQCIKEEVVVSDCAKDVTCKKMTPPCEAPLVPVSDGKGCWGGCGYPETCSCDDGQPNVCDMEPPACTDGTILAEQGGCYECVDPMTCKAPVEDECTKDGDCFVSKYEFMVTNIDDCFCEMCPNWAMPLSEHKARETAWVATCKQWSDDEPCPIPGCLEPGPAVCDAAGQCVLSSANKCAEGVLCKMTPPKCKPPLVPVADGACWGGCGYPETCSCDDGAPLVCDGLVPVCPKGTVVAVQKGCHECVDPMTCGAPKGGVDPTPTDPN